MSGKQLWAPLNHFNSQVGAPGMAQQQNLLLGQAIA